MTVVSRDVTASALASRIKWSKQISKNKLQFCLTSDVNLGGSGSYHNFFYREGRPEFFGVVKGWNHFFSVCQRGVQNFLRVKEGSIFSNVLRENGCSLLPRVPLCPALPYAKGGDQNFLSQAKGGGTRKKLVTGHHKQIPPPIKKW